MSLREFDYYVRGYSKRLEQQQHLLAWHAANIMGMWAKKGSKITPGKLMGTEKSVDPRDLQRELSEMAAKASGQAENLAEDIVAESDYDAEDEAEDVEAWINGVLLAAEIDDLSATLDE